MRLLLSKKQRRQLQLLEILIKEKRWFHLKELAKRLDCTERSLKEDLSNLRSTFDDFLIDHYSHEWPCAKPQCQCGSSHPHV